MNIFTIPAHSAFSDNLVLGVMARYGADILSLSQVTILLPTRRICRAVQEAFLRHSGGKPMLLPVISPIDDSDEEELLLHASSGLIPPAITPLRQVMSVAQLIISKQNTITDITQAIHLATELVSFLAEMQAENCSFENLESLVPEYMAEHWQHTLDFLHLFAHDWPEVLAIEGVIDAASRRTRVVDAQLAFWEQNPPKGPVIITASTGGMAASTRLLQAIAAMPQGVVIVPGLDRGIDEESWTHIGLSHPQWECKKLLALLQVPHQSVGVWHSSEVVHAREVLIREVMRPAETTHHWQSLQTMPVEVLEGITLVESATLQQEAMAIACMMRETLEHPGKTIALITQERRLARRVSSLLKRWDIQLEDTAGSPLQSTPAGAFLHLIAEMIEADAAPVPLLALLKHPLAAAGMEPWLFRKQVYALEIAVLRGVRVAPGIAGIKDALLAIEAVELYNWTIQLETLLLPFMTLMQQQEAPLDALLRAHIQLAELLAASHEQEGAARLWAEDSGGQVADFLAELLVAAKGFGLVDTKNYAGLFTVLCSEKQYKPRAAQHPRLFLLSPKEARLQQFDKVILGGMAEGSWPQSDAADPWMNRDMRQKIGLPLPEQKIGQSAHDFVCHLYAPEVVLSWCGKVDGVPTVPSRWLLRLFTVLTTVGLREHLAAGSPWNQWAELLDRPEAVIPLLPPAPTPPLESRPRILSVTHVERWMRDPYALYASKILKLRALDPLDADPGMAEFGNFIHKALDQFNRIYPTIPANNHYHTLLECGYQALKEVIDRPAVRHFWMPRFERIAAWMVAFEQERRQGSKIQIVSEVEGRVTLGDAENPFILTAKADRLELNALGEMVIIDFKTGTVPSAADIELGISPQLTLEALIAERLGFSTVKRSSCQVKELLYVRLTGGELAGEITPVNKDIATLAANARTGVEALIRAFDQVETAYLCCPWPEKAPAYNDYAHFSRIKEWRNG